MFADNCLIIVKGIDKTNSIQSYSWHGDKCDIIYKNTDRVFRYNGSNVEILNLVKDIDPCSVILRVNGRVITGISKIESFGEYFRITFSNGMVRTFSREDVRLERDCLYNATAKELFDYFRETAIALSIKINGVNILQYQYDLISSISEATVLANFFNLNLPIRKADSIPALIYPFGINQSQKTAVENAFSSQISIIQGPPGTGKTQTILSIVANAVRQGKTVAVVSNNNSATQNVVDKLDKFGLSFLTAFLGSLANKEHFVDSQVGRYPDMGDWQLSEGALFSLNEGVRQLCSELTSMLEARNRIAQIEQDLLALKPEQFYFDEYYHSKADFQHITGSVSGLSSKQILSLWLEYEGNGAKKLGFFRKIIIALRFNRSALELFRHVPEEAIPFLQDLFYKIRLYELKEEKHALEKKLRDFQFNEKMEELRSKSMKLFRAELARRYRWQSPRKIFKKTDFLRATKDFVAEYPVILSTTYAIKGTLARDFVYDYLIVDEASQVDLATGVLAMACARNIVIVGDQMQLPNVLTPDNIQKADEIWSRHHLDERYHFTTHSLLAATTEIWSQAPSVLLREHYRCHPKIAAFFNQKFYNSELIVMTEDCGEKNVLSMYRTVPGNHARGHVNQRQIDTIRAEVLPALVGRGYTDIGVITPYRDQVAAIQKQLGMNYDVATVHKFQGREKEAIVLASVDNVIGKFVDDPNMLNVAVSRAVKSLSVVISNNPENAKTNYGDLARYIEYNNCQIVDSKVYSVFDMLYREYGEVRKQYLKKHRRISKYDSENLLYAVIEKITATREFSQVNCATHFSMSLLVKDYSLLSDEERSYASNPLTHLDFLLYNRMDKAPILAIEVDGTRFHADGSRQAERDAVKNSIMQKCGVPILRLRTDGSSEETRIAAALRAAM